MEPEILKFMRKNAYKPLTAEELHQSFADLEWNSFIDILNQMEAEGKIVRTRSHRYGVPERLNLVRGRLQGNAKGFGFVIPDAEFPFEQDVFIHGTDMNGAMDGDFVLARVESYKKEGRRPEGEIVRILKRGRTEAVGTYSASKHFGFVIPDDKRLSSDIFIPKEAIGGAKEGDKVVVELTSYPKGRRSAEGRVKEVIGHKDDPGVDILSIIRKYHLPEAFPTEVIKEAETVPDSITADEIQGRRDLRGRRMVTIDGEDAKDLDDAVSVETLEGGNIRLGVHIADVSYYVKENSALDREAYLRGNSVYLVDRVIPMLPQRLSNGICSLNPQVDRLTMTCDMELDGQGNLIHHEIYPSVIQTDERMTYHDVKRILVDEDPELIQRYQPLVEDFRLMGRLAKILNQRRVNRGAIDFDFPEAKILVDPQGKPVEIVKRPRTVAEQMIEEFMLAANETVSEHFFKRKIPFLYRIHERPNPDKLQSFVEFITRFGHSVRGKIDRIKPRALQQLLHEIKGEPEEPVISKVMLRSMQQAKYSPECLGHFGLAAPYYSHFTSPIRRYPDLMIHRIIREVLENEGKLSDKQRSHFKDVLPATADHTSERERIAIDAERETDDLKKAEFMMDKVGEIFTGTISSVTSFGVFVELENTVEGLVHVSYMTDDYYHFNEYSMSLIGERTGKEYNIGDPAQVRVTGVNLDERKVDFEFTEGEDSDSPRAAQVPSAETKVKKPHKPTAGRTGRTSRATSAKPGKPSTSPTSRRRKSKEKGHKGKRNKRKR